MQAPSVVSACVLFPRHKTRLAFSAGVKPFDFSGSGLVWVQQRFQISVQFRLRFR